MFSVSVVSFLEGEDVGHVEDEGVELAGAEFVDVVFCFEGESEDFVNGPGVICCGFDHGV